MQEAAEDMLEATEDMPEAAKDMPEAAKDMPEAAKDMPDAAKDMPEAAKDMPEAAKDMLTLQFGPDMQKPLPERDMPEAQPEQNMSITIGNFLKKYNLNDTKLASYDNDTKQIIAEILNGDIDKHVGSENGTILLYIGFYYDAIKKDRRSFEKYYIMAAEHNNSYAMHILGNIYYNQNKLDLAEKYYLMTAEHNDSSAMLNLANLYKKQKKLDLATKYYLKALLFDAGIIGYIINIISKTSLETQLEILELVPEIRATDEYFNKLHREVYFRYTNKKVEMAQRLACHLNGDVIGICLEYY